MVRPNLNGRTNVKNRYTAALGAMALAAFAVTASAQQTIILVRHAELEGAAMAAPKYLPLSEAGEERAKRLAAMLKDSGVGAIYVTDFVRTQKTAEPLGKALNRPITVVPKGDAGELVERLREFHGQQTVLLVGHTDTLPGLLKALGHPADIKIAADDFGSLFVVVPRPTGAPTLVQLRY